MLARPLADADDFDPAIAALIRHKARRMSYQNALSREDEEDLCQNLALALLVAFSRHDAKRGSRYTLARAVIATKAIDVMRREYAKQRSRARQRGFEDGCGGSVQARVEPLDTVLDVRSVMVSFPPELRAIALLFELHSEAEVIRQSGLSRQQVRTSKARIAAHFIARGLGRKKSSRSSTNPSPLAVHTKQAVPHRVGRQSKPGKSPVVTNEGSCGPSPSFGATDAS